MTGCLAFAKSKKSAASFHGRERVGAAGHQGNLNLDCHQGKLNLDSRGAAREAEEAQGAEGAEGAAAAACAPLQRAHVATGARAEDAAPAHSAGVRKEYTALTLHRVPLGRHVHWASRLAAYFGEDAPSANSKERVEGGEARGGEEEDGGEVQGGEEKADAGEKCHGTIEAGARSEAADKACVLEVLSCSPLAPQDACEVCFLWVPFRKLGAVPGGVPPPCHVSRNAEEQEEEGS